MLYEVITVVVQRLHRLQQQGTGEPAGIAADEGGGLVRLGDDQLVGLAAQAHAPEPIPVLLLPVVLVVSELYPTAVL